jgi:hypothetical protein
MPLLTIAYCLCQVSLSKDAADPPDLETAKGKGDQSKLELSPVQVVHHAAC